MNVRVRKEFVRCKECKALNEFMYLSDFSYGEQLVTYDNGHKYAYIRLIGNEIYDYFVDTVKWALKSSENKVDDFYVKKVINKIFHIACDKIGDSSISLKCEKKCFNCGSNEFEASLAMPEEIVEVELMTVTHNDWLKLSNVQKKNHIIEAIRRIDG